MSFLFDTFRIPERDFLMNDITKILFEVNIRIYRIKLLLQSSPNVQLLNSIIFMLREYNKYLEKLLLVSNLENSASIIQDKR